MVKTYRRGLIPSTSFQKVQLRILSSAVAGRAGDHVSARRTAAIPVDTGVGRSGEPGRHGGGHLQTQLRLAFLPQALKGVAEHEPRAGVVRRIGAQAFQHVTGACQLGGVEVTAGRGPTDVQVLRVFVQQGFQQGEGADAPST